MDFDRQPNLARLFFDRAALEGQRPFLWRKTGGGWQALSYAETAAQVRALAAGLIALGVAPGDRVALVAENRPEWLIADLAIMAAGALSVPAFATNTVEDHLHILTHSGAKGVIVAGETIARRLLPAAIQSPALQFLIAIDGLTLAQGLPFRSLDWGTALALGSDAATATLDARIAAQSRADCCCIIYTSGTGGAPKGVMLSHGAILSNVKGASLVLQQLGLKDAIFLSFLPLSHSYEHTAGQFFPIGIGAQIYYAESVEKLMDNMAEARPTIMLAVPRLYEVMRAKIERGLTKASPWQQKMFRLTLALGQKRLAGPGRLSFSERVLDFFCDLLVRRKIKARFGGRLKAFVSGGAALNAEIGLYFLALGLRLLQGYGQTEAAPVISTNVPHRIKIDTVGPPLAGVTCKRAEDGEILVRGEAVMLGYWQDATATAAAIRDGWLHTGDIGTFDADGYLKITDRKKDIIVLSGGDNISPARIEGFLILQAEIGQAMVYGDGRAHLIALLVPDGDFVRNWARRNAKSADLAALIGESGFQQDFARVVERVNAGLSTIERIRRFALLPEAFTIDNGMLTPSLKIKRHRIRAKYASLIEQLYERG